MSVASIRVPHSPKTRAVHALRGFIERSGLRDGDRLPAESRLAAEIGVSRMTLRSALDLLQREGLVRRERNLGCICAVPSPTKEGLMSQTIVLITDHGLASSSRVFTGASSSVVSGVIDRTSQHGLNFLRVHADQATEEWLTDLIAARPHGVVMSCWNRPIEWQLKVLARLRAQHIPVVAWGDSPYFNDFDHLGSDHVSGTVGLVHALAAAGRKRLLRVWTIPSTVAWIAAHNQGYDTATAALQLEQIPAVYIEGFADRGQPPSERNFRIRVRQFAGHLAEHLHSANAIDAIMVGTDCEVPVAIAACRLFGRADIPVTGYDNYWDLAPEREWEPTPPFATVDKGNHLIGEELVDLLLARRSGTLPSEPQRRPIAQQIVELAR